MKRVVITGISPIGSGWQEIANNLKQMKTGVVRVDDWTGLKVWRRVSQGLYLTLRNRTTILEKLYEV